MPAAYAAASVVVSAATQDEGLQRTILEAQAMARPVIVSDLGAGPEVVLAPPSVSEDRMTGLRFSAGDDAALAAALIRLFSMPEAARRAIGARGREWVTSHFDALGGRRSDPETLCRSGPKPENLNGFRIAASVTICEPFEPKRSSALTYGPFLPIFDPACRPFAGLAKLVATTEEFLPFVVQ